MSEPEFDHDDPDEKSMFDFLTEEGVEKHRRKKRASEASERALPIIRKPVPVSESGPLLPPKPGAPVETPPALTDGSTVVEDDLSFLDDRPGTFADSPSRRSDLNTSDSDTNVRRLDPRSRRIRGEDRKAGTESARVGKAPASRINEFDDFELDLGDAPEFNRNRNRKGVRVVAEDDYYDDDATPRRGRWALLALVLIVAGVGSFLFANPDGWRTLVQKFGLDPGSRTVVGGSPKGSPEGSPAVDPNGDALAVDGEAVLPASPMMQRFREQLSLVEGLIADGALDDAERALSNMDRTVYGYGAAEFGDLESRIAQLRSGVIVADPAAEQAERNAAARIAEQEATQAARDVEARAAAEQTQREEQARAAAQAAREEEARIAAAAVQAAQEKSAGLAAAEKSSREEQAKVAAQQAEQARLNAEKARQEAARLEQARKAEQERLASLAARTSDWPSVEADRQATDRRIAEERAAMQRKQAREQRLIEAREREASLAAQAASRKPADVTNAAVPRDTADTSRTAAVPAANSENNDVKVAAGPQSIGDDELQTVYRRFIDLQQAVSNRDINAVVRLTQRSGARVQQLMQIFENSTQIDARIRNVSTSNATGQIKGTLQINRIKRADGTFVEPPAALSSIPLSSQREGDGWSAISW